MPFNTKALLEDFSYEMASAGSRRNAVCFELQEDLEMDRLQFSWNVIQKELAFTPAQLDYVFALPGKKTFEVIFSTYALFEQCLLLAFSIRKRTTTQDFTMCFLPLFRRENPKQLLSLCSLEKVTPEDIRTWLSFHCSVLRSMELRDEDGIRTGARRFYVQLRRDGDSGKLHHLPPTICWDQLGAIFSMLGSQKPAGNVARYPTLQLIVIPSSAETARVLTTIPKTVTNQ